MAPLASLCYLLLSLPVRSLAAPVTSSVGSQLFAASGNLTLLRTEIAPAWASTANYRGTADIVWSCLLTLTACIYNAIHLNVPQNHESTLRRLGRRLVWVAIALFAPEIVLYTAYAQYSKARKLVRVLNSLRFGDAEEAKKEEKKAKNQIDDKHVDANSVVEAKVLVRAGTSENTGMQLPVDNYLHTPQIEQASIHDPDGAPIIILAAKPSLAGDSDEVALEKPTDVTITKHDNEVSRERNCSVSTLIVLVLTGANQC